MGCAAGGGDDAGGGKRLGVGHVAAAGTGVFAGEIAEYGAGRKWFWLVGVGAGGRHEIEAESGLLAACSGGVGGAAGAGESAGEPAGVLCAGGVVWGRGELGWNWLFQVA